jgi:peptidyl-dipeptidase Dcp
LWPEVLAQYACHFATNEPIPPELIRKVLDASTFNQGFKTVEYLAAAVLDQAWHELAGEDIPEDVEQFEEQVLTRAGLRQPWIAPRYKTCYFQHVFSGGYAARYYAYIWSEVLDADAEQWFRDRGGMTRANGEHLRDEVLKHGGSIDPATLFSNFRGGEPSINALLVRRGLNESAA